MRILQVTMGLGVGGAEMALLRASRELKKHQHEVKVLCLAPIKNLESSFINEGIEVFYLPSLLVSPQNLLRLRQFTEVLQTWMPHSNLLSPFLKMVFQPKITLWNVRQALGRFHEIRFLSRCILRASVWFSGLPDAIIYNSTKGQLDHEKLGYPSHKAVIIPNGFDIPETSIETRKKARQQWGVQANELVFLFVGRDNIDKGFKYFYQAALQMPPKNMVFMVAGQGFDKDCRWRHGLPEKQKNRFVFLGGLSEKDVHSLYLAGDVINSTSVTEGFSNVLGEGMAHSLVAVATDVGDSKKILGDTGWLIREDDVDQVVEAWSQVLTLSPDLLEERKQIAKKHIETMYSLDSCTMKYLNTYEKLLKNKDLSKRGLT